MVDIHVHILIGDHFIEITLACVIGEEERGGVRGQDFNLQGCFQGVNLLVEGFGAGFDAPVRFGGLVGSRGRGRGWWDDGRVPETRTRYYQHKGDGRAAAGQR